MKVLYTLAIIIFIALLTVGCSDGDSGGSDVNNTPVAESQTQTEG